MTKALNKNKNQLKGLTRTGKVVPIGKTGFVAEELKVSDCYKLPKPVILELSKIMQYNDSCISNITRVTREETMLLLNQYGWKGTTASLNRLLKANFGRSFAGTTTQKVR